MVDRHICCNKDKNNHVCGGFLALTITELGPEEHTGSGSVIDVPGDKKLKVSKGEKIRNRYNQVPHLTQDTYGKVTNSQFYATNESQEVSPFPAVNKQMSTKA